MLKPGKSDSSSNNAGDLIERRPNGERLNNVLVVR